MLSISTSLHDPEYLLGMAQLNYYTLGGEPLGKWFGGGTDAFGLSGTVDPTALRNLFKGLSPDGNSELVQNANDPKRQCAWDLTFSADKSISVAWAVGDKEQRAAIETSQELAVQRALKFLQDEAGWTRRGKDSKIHERSPRLFFAVFQHGTSRAGDPNLHHHCLLLNLCVRDDSTTGSIVTKEIFRLKMIAGLIYRQELGRQLHQRLGFGLIAQRTWLEIDGVPKSLCEEFSKRRKEVLAHLEKMGKSDAKSAAHATKATRREKEFVPRETLFAGWTQIAREKFGFTHESLKAIRRFHHPERVSVMLKNGLDQLLSQNSFFSDRQYLRRVLELSQATGHAADHVLLGVRHVLGRIVNLGVHDGRQLYTTRSVLDLEEKLFFLATTGRFAKEHQVDWNRASRAGAALSESQKTALRHLVAEPGDTKVLQGLAGTGKSSLLKSAADLWRSAGFRVIGAAYSGKAADGLAESAGIESHTVDRLLLQWSKARSAVKPLDGKSILVVDEAGMLDTKKMLEVVVAAKRAGAKLVLVGDEKQLPPIAAGAPFAELGKRLGRSELTEIQRQKNPLLRLVVEHLAAGDIRKALGWMKHDRLLRLHETADDAKDTLVRDWQRIGSPRKAIMLAGTRDDVLDLNLRAQAALGRRLKILAPMFSMNEVTFRIGDRVLFGRNDRLLGVRNGSIGELTTFNPFTRMASVTLDGGKAVYVPIDKYRHLSLGYCLTTHKAQGLTVDRTFVLWSDSMQSREMTYVQASRSRISTQFYLTRSQAGVDFDQALKDIERSVAKDVAISKIPDPDRGRSRDAERSPSL